MEVFKHLALSKLCVQLNLLQRQRMNLRGQGMNEAVGINQRRLKFAFPFLILRSFELSNEIKNQLLFLERIKHETPIRRSHPGVSVPQNEGTPRVKRHSDPVDKRFRANNSGPRRWQ